MNVLIAGSSLMALRIVETLMNRHQVVWLRSEDRQDWKLDQLNAEVMMGEITSPQFLSRAGAEESDVFVACSSNDEQNIVACIAARRLGTKKTICVVNGRGFLTNSAEGPEIARSLGIDQVVRPIEQLSNELISIVRVPGALEVEMIADGRLGMFRYGLSDCALAAGRTLADLTLPNNTRLVFVRRGDEPIVPRGDTVLRSGDKVIAMGTAASLGDLGAQFCDTTIKKREAAIIGGGRVGRAVARGLMAAGFRVTVVEASAERCEIIAQRTEALVLHGDGTDVDFLEQEHIGEMPIVIAVTDSDERNLLVSLVMKQLGSSRVFTRADRLSNERLFERVGVDVVRSAKGAAIRNILRSIDESESTILAEFEHGMACLLELTLSDHAREIPLAALAPPALAVVGAVLRGDQTIIPTGRDTLRARDHLFVFCAKEDEDDIREYFGGPDGPQPS
jgi:trk system potassium uptake protein TrkA